MTPEQLEKMQNDANETFKVQVAEHAARIRKEAFEIKVQVEEGGKLPAKANVSDAGFDLYATEDITIYPGQVKTTPLNIRLALPVGTWGNVTSKSGLGSKGLLVYAGVIDQEYRGIVHVIMSNINVIQDLDEEGIPLMNTTPIRIQKGNKIAQLIMNNYSDQYYLKQVDALDTNTTRGTGGFGSTGA